MTYPSDAARRSVTLATARPLLAYHGRVVARAFAGNGSQGEDHGPVPNLWLNEFNWGGNWEGPETWPEERNGVLRGLLWVSYYLAAAQQHTAQGAPATYAALHWYSLFSQPYPQWGQEAAVAGVGESSNATSAITVNGVAQIFAHVAHVSLRRNFTHMAPWNDSSARTLELDVLGEGSQPCLQAAVLTSNTNSTSRAFLLLNVCARNVTAHLPLGHLGAATLRTCTYSAAADRAPEGLGFVPLAQINSVAAPPWQNGPLDVVTAAVQVRGGGGDGGWAPLNLGALSFVVAETA